MSYTRLVDGVRVNFSASEVTERQAAEAAWTAGADDRAAEENRRKRNELLSESDWTQMNDSQLSNEAKTAWATYRQELRDLSDLAAWPNLEDADWPLAP
mgnify:FL=1